MVKFTENTLARLLVGLKLPAIAFHLQLKIDKKLMQKRDLATRSVFTSLR